MNKLERLEEAYKLFIAEAEKNDMTMYDYSPNNENWDFYHSVTGYMNEKYFMVDFMKLKSLEDETAKICIYKGSRGCIGKIRKILKDYKNLIE